ncbi:uncharacterized protein LOC144675894 [Cetorhinus maximus]
MMLGSGVYYIDCPLLQVQETLLQVQVTLLAVQVQETLLQVQVTLLAVQVQETLLQVQETLLAVQVQETLLQVQETLLAVQVQETLLQVQETLLAVQVQETLLQVQETLLAVQVIGAKVRTAEWCEVKMKQVAMVESITATFLRPLWGSAILQQVMKQVICSLQHWKLNSMEWDLPVQLLFLSEPVSALKHLFILK